MLLRRTVLEGIKSGEITLVFRRWRKPTVKTGGTLKTPQGVLAIQRVEKCRESGITAADARQAGYGSRAELLQDLGSREGDLYRITVGYAGADPRIQLREDDQLDDQALADLREKLDRLDRASRVGAWTGRVLQLIRDNPRRPAGELAEQLGWERLWFKAQVRKLKNLGLTVSCRPGYMLSPRGQTVLPRLAKEVS